MNGAEHGSEKMKDTASQVVVVSVLALLGGVLTSINTSKPMGEMGHFMYAAARVITCFGVWGLATGIGLWRRWRWARISMLIFGGILVAFGTLPPLLLMLPFGGAAEWTWRFILLKVLGLALLLVVLAGGLRWWKYFTGSSVKSYFHEESAPGN